MDLTEIISRPNGAIFDVSEMTYVVERYIKEKKNVSVDINLTKGIDVSDPLGGMFYMNQVNSLMEAFNEASKYFLTKNRA